MMLRKIALLSLLVVAVILVGCSPVNTLNGLRTEHNNEINQGANWLDQFNARMETANQQVVLLQTEYDEDTAVFSTTAQSYIDRAVLHQANAIDAFEQSQGVIAEEYTEHTEAIEATLRQRLEQAKTYNREAKAAIDEFNGLATYVRDTTSGWRRTYLWTEIGDYWSNDYSDWADTQACYYGYIDTTTTPVYETETVETGQQFVVTDVQVQTVHVNEPADRGEQCTGLFGGCADNRGSEWQVFEFGDYQWLVDNGVIAAQPGLGTDIASVGKYLCEGAEPVIYEGLTLIKEEGTNSIEVEDEEEALIGNYDLGQWSRVPDNCDEANLIPEGESIPEGDLGWCWYAPEEGGESNVIYYRSYYLGRWYYYPYGYRCIYCTPTRISGYTSDASINRAHQTGVTRSGFGSDFVGGGSQAGK